MKLHKPEVEKIPAPILTPQDIQQINEFIMSLETPTQKPAEDNITHDDEDEVVSILEEQRQEQPQQQLQHEITVRWKLMRRENQDGWVKNITLQEGRSELKLNLQQQQLLTDNLDMEIGIQNNLIDTIVGFMD